MKAVYFRNNQPHFQYIGRAFSITVISHDAVPQPVIDKLRAARQQALRDIDEDDLPDKAYRKGVVSGEFEQQLEKLLHRKRHQEHPFKNPSAAAAVAEAIQEYDGRFYTLISYAVMSNHVHLVIDPALQVPDDYDGTSDIKGYVNVDGIIGRVKGKAAYNVRQAIDRPGTPYGATVTSTAASATSGTCGLRFGTYCAIRKRRDW